MKAKRHQIIKENNDGEEKDELGNHNGLGCDQIDVKSKKTNKKENIQCFLEGLKKQKKYMDAKDSFKIK